MSKILIDEVTVKQVLEYVESVPDDRYAVEHIDRDTLVTDLREALNASLAKPDFWEGYVPEPVKPRGEATLAQQEFVSPGGGYVPAIPAQQALDKKAENARELGLDYEPAQQEPVAWMTKAGSVWKTKADETDTPLYTKDQL
jgi:hypothetical protein